MAEQSQVCQDLLTERVGFEPTEACTSAVFKTAALNHSPPLQCVIIYYTMNILSSEKRLAFERLLVKLGYKDRMPIYEKEDKKYQQTNFKCTDGAMAIYTFLIVYKTKKSYLWLEFLDNYDDPDLENKIRRLAKKIRFYEKTRLIEVGYEVKYTKQPSEFSLEERRKIFTTLYYTHTNIFQTVC